VLLLVLRLQLVGLLVLVQSALGTSLALPLCPWGQVLEDLGGLVAVGATAEACSGLRPITPQVVSTLSCLLLHLTPRVLAPMQPGAQAQQQQQQEEESSHLTVHSGRWAAALQHTCNSRWQSLAWMSCRAATTAAASSARGRAPCLAPRAHWLGLWQAQLVVLQLLVVLRCRQAWLVAA
jgi:hypothetical protein